MINKTEAYEDLRKQAMKNGLDQYEAAEAAMEMVLSLPAKKGRKSYAKKR